MGHFQTLLNHPVFAGIITILLGVGLSCMFRNSCENGLCILHIAPSYNLQDETFKWNGNCYKYNREKVACPLKGEEIIHPLA